MKKSKFIIPVFIPHIGCKFACVFCNQKKITGINPEIDLISIKKHIETFLQYRKNKNQMGEIAFYGGSFLWMKKNIVLSLLVLAEEFVQKKKNQEYKIFYKT